MKPDERIVEAYYRVRGYEDRVTQVLATVFSGVPSYVDCLADLVGLEATASYQVETQVRASGSVIDLEIRAEGRDDQPVWLLWSEHKVHAPFSEKQLARYASELREQAGALDRRMIAITLGPPSPEIRAEAEDNEVCLLRWRDLCGLAEKAGRRVAGSSWRVQAGSGSNELARRLLLDWFTFYENELEEFAMEPLTHRMAELLPEATRAVNAVDNVLGVAFEAACEEVGGGKLEEEDDYFCAVPAADITSRSKWGLIT